MSEVDDDSSADRARFLADENLESAIVHGLRLHEPQLDILVSGEAGILGFSDPDVLAYAAENDRILISHDKRTLPHHFAQFQADGHNSPGLMLISRKFAIGKAIEALLLVWHASAHSEWSNTITRLPL